MLGLFYRFIMRPAVSRARLPSGRRPYWTSQSRAPTSPWALAKPLEMRVIAYEASVLDH